MLSSSGPHHIRNHNFRTGKPILGKYIRTTLVKFLHPMTHLLPTIMLVSNSKSKTQITVKLQRMTAHHKLLTALSHKKRTAKPTTPNNPNQTRDTPRLATMAPDLSDWEWEEEVELESGQGSPFLSPLHSLAKRPGGYLP